MLGVADVVDLFSHHGVDGIRIPGALSQTTNDSVCRKCHQHCRLPCFALCKNHHSRTKQRSARGSAFRGEPFEMYVFALEQQHTTDLRWNFVSKFVSDGRLNVPALLLE